MVSTLAAWDKIKGFAFSTISDDPTPRFSIVPRTITARESRKTVVYLSIVSPKQVACKKSVSGRRSKIVSR